MLIILFVAVFLFIALGNCLRIHFLNRAVKMSEPRSIDGIQGRDVIERMMAEERITDISVKFSDFIVPRYYYSFRRKCITIPTFTNYSSGLYDIMRCATVSSLAIFSKADGGGLYYRLSPFMEVWVRIMPIVLVVLLYMAAVFPFYALVSLAVVYFVSIMASVMMRRKEGEAAANASRWLLKNGIVSDSDSETLDKLTRYVTNYNMVNVLMAGFAITSARRGGMSKWLHDK